MRKIQILILILLAVLSGCAKENRLDASGVEAKWLENVATTEAPPPMPTAPAETEPLSIESAPGAEETQDNTEPVPTEPADKQEMREAPAPRPTEAMAAEPKTQWLEPWAAEPQAPEATELAEEQAPAVMAEQETEKRTTGMQKTTLTLSGGRDVNCWLYVPESSGAALGLIVYLHGGSGKGDDLDLITQAGGFPQYLQSGQLGSLSSYVLIPQLSKELKGWSDMDGTLMEMIGTLVRDYGLDASNISLTGHSMGGTGTWSMAVAHPGYFARIAPLSGSIRNTPENMQALKNTPVSAFVGAEDTIVKPESSREFVEALVSAGGDAKITELEGADHFAVPGFAYLGGYGLVEWLQGF